MKTCHVCKTTLPDNARFCFNCGAPQRIVQTVLTPQLNLRGNVEQQIEEQFFLAFRERIEAEHGANVLENYSNRLYQSGFQEVISRRAEQLAAQIHILDQADELSDRRMAGLLVNAIEDLLDYFIIRHCSDLNAIPLPEAILSYQGLKWADVNFFQMVMHYLDFAKEQETIYTDFLAMPLDRLKNASQSFLHPQPQERIFFICDQSILGSVREGFAMTERGIYWKAQLEKARQVTYDNLQTIERKKEWITINGFFFNVNQSVNLKMLKLLKKIKRFLEYE
ncbi:MAG: zinc ribbon domain-containing protein [Saprospiraceae bacterium]|nr:zinc ribbon domain-containing protein [Saprospiraceae bacterium]